MTRRRATAVTALSCSLCCFASWAEVDVLEQDTGLPYAALHTGGGLDRFDLVIVGDGFTLDEQALFDARADEAVAALEAMSGFGEDLCAFNVWRINVVSAQSGIDDPANGVRVDTELDVRKGARVFGETARGLYSDSPEKIFEAAALAPDFDSVFVLANHPEGGTAFGQYALSGVGPGFANTFTHELGHSVGGLADEYECYFCDGTDDGRSYPDGGVDPDYPNVTTADTREGSKWVDLIEGATPVPTLEDDPPGVVGLFEGGYYHAEGISRPAFACHMRDSDVPGLCPVCRAHVAGLLTPTCLVLHEPRLTEFELIEALPERIRRVRWPLPVCLQCPDVDRPEIELVIEGVRGDVDRFRVLRADGTPIEHAVRAARRPDGVRLRFSTEAGERTFLEYGGGGGEGALAFRIRVLAEGKPIALPAF